MELVKVNPHSRGCARVPADRSVVVRVNANTDATLRRLEAREDHAMVPWVWQVEVGNALGKVVTRAKGS